MEGPYKHGEQLIFCSLTQIAVPDCCLEVAADVVSNANLLAEGIQQLAND
jgi:hypothetical protein